ncbi:MAG: MFS transporter [Gammaproteobacteria bacterium]|nr:MFS transporter [Gammaproteobacteria bacterium]
MPLAAYFRFIADNRRFVAFGFTMGFASSFGQTFFIGLFGPALRSEFGLSHTSWGFIYLIGTLASALLLPFTGRKIDQMDLRLYTTLVCALMIFAGLFTALVNGPLMLIAAIFLLRQSGQGLMSHTAMSSMARYFEEGRGRALAIATMGFSCGEALLPVGAVFLIALVGWRWSYVACAILVAVVLIPLVRWLLAGHDERHRQHLQRLTRQAGDHQAVIQSWTQAQVLRDSRFYLLLPGLLAPPMIGTAMFFHHLTVADFKGWSHTWITGNYAVYALVAITIALLSGPLIDRFRAVRMVYGVIPPLILAMLALAAFQTHWIVPVYLALIGVNTGLSYTVMTSLWAEIYGVAYIGSVKSMVAAIGVLGSALGPVIMGRLMDEGFSVESICVIAAAYALIGWILMAVALRPAAHRSHPPV